MRRLDWLQGRELGEESASCGPLRRAQSSRSARKVFTPQQPPSAKIPSQPLPHPPLNASGTPVPASHTFGGHYEQGDGTENTLSKSADGTKPGGVAGTPKGPRQAGGMG